MKLRKFYLKHYGPRHQWWFGEGTRNEEGDYILDGKYSAKSGRMLESLEGHRDVVECDPDLEVMAGL